MDPILCGIETEYGLSVEGRGAEDQIDDSMALIRSYPDECFLGWDYRFESPRADLRGFTLKHLTADPNDAKFDLGKVRGSDQEVRSDRVLPNGARLYNDHGHPEYATPECWTAFEAAKQDKAGELAVLNAAAAFSAASGRAVRLYKNNTDFHGSSYGTHESYLVPRSVGWERLYAAVLPMLVARQVLTGAGKVGSESGSPCRFQVSQRADFFVEPLNAETLSKRPIFNTRDEPHADPAQWMRLHVISGDANMMPGCTMRKLALVKIAIWLAMADKAPQISIADPVQAFQSVSRDDSYAFVMRLSGGESISAGDLIRAYVERALEVIEPADERVQSDLDVAASTLSLIDALTNDWDAFRRSCDWAAKKHMLQTFTEESGAGWDQAALQAYDLEYHNIQAEDGLYHALLAMDEVEQEPWSSDELDQALKSNSTGSRALIRSLAIRRFPRQLIGVSWRALTFQLEDGPISVELPPNWSGSVHDLDVPDVESFIERIRSFA